MKKGLSVDTKGNVHADTAFLEAFVAKGGKVQEIDATDDSLLNEVGKDQKSKTRTADALHKEVETKLGEDDTASLSTAEAKAQKQAEAEAKKAADAAKRLNKRRISTVEKTLDSARKATDPIVKKAGHVTDRFARARTVGGIGLLLFILIFLLFIVVEVNSYGDTRIKQLWYMLLGRAALIGRRQVTTGETAQPTSTTPSLQDQLSAAALASLGPIGISIEAIENSFRPSDPGF
jgi:hypothetical protein